MKYRPDDEYHDALVPVRWRLGETFATEALAECDREGEGLDEAG